MDKKDLSHFKEKLLMEKSRVNTLLEQMNRNETINSKAEISSELSLYDNHPADVATEISDIEKGMALKQNELSLIIKVDKALESIDDGSYGKCKKCGKDIIKERLEFIPYAQYCATCQDIVQNSQERTMEDRPIEEAVLDKPFGYGYNDLKDDMEYDAEDSYQGVDRFNRLEKIYEFSEDDEDYVDPIERISNEQYKNQLPD